MHTQTRGLDPIDRTLGFGGIVGQRIVLRVRVIVRYVYGRIVKTLVERKRILTRVVIQGRT